MQNEDILTMPRIISCEVIPWEFQDGHTDEIHQGEAIRLKAAGSYIHENCVFPASLHITVPVGHPAIPPMGDLLKVVISRVEASDYPSDVRGQ